jgi:RNA polymerase sigma-70 factor, ECF subfamily
VSAAASIGALRSPGVVRERARANRSSMAQPLDITALYERYGDMVQGRCRTLLGDAIEAQDAAQEVFLRLHRYRDRFRGDASPATYLFKVTTTTCLNVIRSRRRRREHPVSELPPVAANDSMMSRIEVRDLVQHHLAGEDERTVAAVVYHYVDGMTHRETGEMLGVTGAAVRKRIAGWRRRVAARGTPGWLDTEDAKSQL